MESLNSALHWFPRIQHLAVPRTFFVAYDHADWIAAPDEGRSPRDMESVTSAIIQASYELGYPVFLRTDLASAKHGGPESYLICKADDTSRVLWMTVEDNEMKFWLDSEQPAAFMVRQYLNLNAPFVAFSGLPIANEWRYFVRDGGVACRHFYWPQAALRFYGDREPEGWQATLRSLRGHRPPSIIEDQALRAAAACDSHDYWSVDVAEDRTGRWWLIDMAIGEQSWHPTCKRGKA